MQDQYLLLFLKISNLFHIVKPLHNKVAPFHFAFQHNPRVLRSSDQRLSPGTAMSESKPARSNLDLVNEADESVLRP